jgi:gallidermin/nisin family lantibiotic
MKIAAPSFTAFTTPSELKTKSSQANDIYDLDLDVSVSAKGPKTPEQNQLVTSKSLCTPTCGNTGTHNSFCC